MATTYIVTWDIKSPERIAQIIEKLKETHFYCPIHANAWAIRTEQKAPEIRDSLLPLTITPDKLFVIRTGTEAAWSGSYGAKNVEWLKKYL